MLNSYYFAWKRSHFNQKKTGQGKSEHVRTRGNYFVCGLLLVDLRADSEEDGEDGEDDVDGGEDDGALLQRVAAEARLREDVDQVLHGGTTWPLSLEILCFRISGAPRWLIKLFEKAIRRLKGR